MAYFNSASKPPAIMNARTGKSRAMQTTEADSNQLMQAFNGSPSQDQASLIRVRENDMAKLEEEITNLRMHNYQLTKKLENSQNAVRRLSNRSGHGFYDYEEDDNSNSERRYSSRSINQNDVRAHEAIVETLEAQILESKQKYATVEQELEELREDGRNKSTTIERLDAANEKLLVGNMEVEANNKVLLEQNKYVTDQNQELKSRLKAFETTIGGKTQMVEKERSRVSQADKRVETMKRSISMLKTREARNEKTMRDYYERNERISKELTESHKVRAELVIKLNLVEARLNAETERYNMEKLAQQHKCRSHAGKGECPDMFRRPPLEKLDEVIKKIDINHDAVNLENGNLKAWRDTVLKEINDSLTMLYCFQKQVETQRDEFVQEYSRRISIESISTEEFGHQSQSKAYSSSTKTKENTDPSRRRDFESNHEEESTHYEEEHESISEHEQESQTSIIRSNTRQRRKTPTLS